MNEDTMTQETEPRQLAPAHFDDDGSDTAAFASTAAPAAADLQAVFDVPVKVQAVLGRARMDIGELMRLKTGDVVELDRRVGEPVDIFVNNRLIARGEVVLIDAALGVTLTEIVRQDR
jgi:flagellar motor switch protein FliN/FliY